MKENDYRRSRLLRNTLSGVICSGFLLAPVVYSASAQAEGSAINSSTSADAQLMRERKKRNRNRGNDQAREERRRNAERQREERNRNAERERNRNAERERNRNAERERNRNAERERNRNAERERNRNAERQREERNRNAERQREERNRNAERERRRNAERERNRNAERQREERNRNAERERRRNAERERNRNAERERRRNVERERERERNRQAEREREERRRNVERERRRNRVGGGGNHAERHRREARRREARRNHRRDWERNHRRRVRRDARHRVIRDRHRWERRHRRWWDNRYRPVYPRPPRRVIVVPIPFPERGNWTFRQVVDVADSLEFLSQKIYVEMERELARHGQWNDQALSEMYDFVEAVREYADKLENYPPHLRYTLYELFNIEEEMLEVKPYMEAGRVSPYLAENFARAEYYVYELLWTYRQNIRDFDAIHDEIVNPIPQDIMYTSVDLNFRFRPATDSSRTICGNLPLGTQVEIVDIVHPEENAFGSNITWAKIAKTPEVEAYITNNSCYSGPGDFYVSMNYLEY